MNKRLPTKVVQFKNALSDIENGMSISDACRANAISRPTYYKLLKRYTEEDEVGLFGKSSAPNNPRKMDANLRTAIRSIVFLNPALSISEIVNKLIENGFQKTPTSTIHWYIRKLGISNKYQRSKWIEEFYKGKETTLNDNQLGFLSKQNSSYLDAKVLSNLTGAYYQIFMLDIGPKFISDRYLHIIINAETGLAECNASEFRNDGFLVQILSVAVSNQNPQFVERLDVVATKSFFVQMEKRKPQINQEGPVLEINEVNAVKLLGMATRCRTWILDYVKDKSGLKVTDAIAKDAITRWNSTRQNNFPLYGKTPITAG